jgi:predicted permease
MAVVLLFAAGLFVRSLTKLRDVRLGVDVDRVAVGSMNLRAVGRTPSEVDQIFAAALDRVARVPGVSHAAVAATTPFGASFGTTVTVHGRDSLVKTFAMFNIVTPEYFRTLGARVLRGRHFSASDGESAPRAIAVDEIWATRYFGTANPVGQCVDIGDSLPCAQIVGVVENIRRQSIFQDSTGFVYLPLAQARHFVSARELVVRIDDRDPATVIPTVRLAIQTAAPGLPYADIQLLADNDIVRREFRPYRLGATLFGVFGLLALALAAIGIYGVISYNVAQRTREMGVRIALGAPRITVASLVVRQGAAVTAVGVGIGALIALAGSRVVSSLLYAQSAHDPFVLGAVVIVLIATAVVACLVPAWRAVNTDPVTALRSD